VIATPLAAEGLAVEEGGNILMAESAERFAEAVLGLLKNEDERQRIGAAGRHTFERYYTWECAWRGLDQELQVKLSEEVNRYT
jgi:glycosyltransferase involved in cell wall biosynthesis